MPPQEILDLVKDGILDVDDIEDFEKLDEEIQELVADGELDMDDAAEL